MFSEFYQTENMFNLNKKELREKTQRFYMNEIFYITPEFYRQNEIVFFQLIHTTILKLVLSKVNLAIKSILSTSVITDEVMSFFNNKAIAHLWCGPSF